MITRVARGFLAPRTLCVLLALSGACGDDRGSTSASATDTTGGDEGPREWRSVIDHQAWQSVEAAADPFADHRPPEDELECGLAGWLIESNTLEVDTNQCNYVTLTQPALVDMTPETPMRLEFRYFDLIAPAPATAHVALQVGDAIVWEREITIPGPAMVLNEDELTAQVEAPAGTPIYFHLHNHGQNTYTLDEVEAEVVVPAP